MNGLCKIILSGLVMFSTFSYASENPVSIEITTVRYTQQVGYFGTAVTENTVFPLDIKYGYAWGNGIYAGGIITTLQNVSSLGVDNIAGVAVDVGYRISGLYADAYYYLLSQLTKANGNTYVSGSSYGLEFGYNVSLGSSYFLGAGLVFKSFLWTEADSPSGTRTLQNNTWVNMYPAINFGISF